MRGAAEAEDRTETATVTPGPFKPAREMLAELLLQMEQPSDALKEFPAVLNKEPNRFRSLYGAAEAAKRAGNSEKANSYFRNSSPSQHAQTNPDDLNWPKPVPQSVTTKPVNSVLTNGGWRTAQL